MRNFSCNSKVCNVFFNNGDYKQTEIIKLRIQYGDIHQHIQYVKCPRRQVANNDKLYAELNTCYWICVAGTMEYLLLLHAVQQFSVCMCVQ
jgi:hypothetical protein